MSAPYFSTDQKACLARVEVLLSELQRTAFHDSPCPLLEIQLDEASVFTRRLAEAIRNMQATFNTDGAA